MFTALKAGSAFDFLRCPPVLCIRRINYASCTTHPCQQQVRMFCVLTPAPDNDAIVSVTSSRRCAPAEGLALAPAATTVRTELRTRPCAMIGHIMTAA
jgi:hypothetical protein